MPQHTGFWTELRLRRLRDGIARGENRKVIAAALGCSKNAVIGKARRLGLSMPMVRDDSDIARRRRLDRRNDLARLRNARAKDRPMTQNERPPPPPRKPAIFWRPYLHATRDTGGPLEIWDLDEHSCRWPLWTDRDPVKFYCGDPHALGSSYCVKHRNKADGRKRA